MTIFSEREGERDRDITSVRYLSVHACMDACTYLHTCMHPHLQYIHTHYSMYMCHDVCSSQVIHPPKKKKFRRAERAENFFWEGWVHSNFRGVLFQNELNFLIGGGYFALSNFQGEGTLG